MRPGHTSEESLSNDLAHKGNLSTGKDLRTVKLQDDTKSQYHMVLVVLHSRNIMQSYRQ